MNFREDNSWFYAAVLFIIWPFLAVASAFRNYRSNWGKNILWAFIAFYGFCFAIGAESESSDIVRYVEQLKNLHRVDMSWDKAVSHYQESGEIDIAQIIITIVVSRVTEKTFALTLVFGIIFGFFFSRNIWYVLQRLKGRISPFTLLLLACFFLVVPFWFINGFRMWTAAHIFLYGLLPYLFEGKKKGVVIATLSILVHYSFLVPVGMLYGYMFLGNRLTLYFVFFISTFFINEINVIFLNNVMESYAPEILVERTDSYLVEQEGQGSGGGGPVWYARYYTIALKYSVLGFLIVLYLNGRDFFFKNKKWLNLFCFTLIFYGTAQLMSILPSGSRYVTVANLFALPLITLYVQNHKNNVVMRRFILAATPALLLFAVVAFRIGLYSLSATAVLGNPLVAPFFTGEHISLNDFLKSLL